MVAWIDILLDYRVPLLQRCACSKQFGKQEQYLWGLKDNTSPTVSQNMVVEFTSK